jgi:hypothetical protein
MRNKSHPFLPVFLVLDYYVYLNREELDCSKSRIASEYASAQVCPRPGTAAAAVAMRGPAGDKVIARDAESELDLFLGD